MLISKAGKKLIADCPTRWSSTPLFTICTFLNLEYKDILNKDQELVATTCLITWMTSSYPEVVVLQQPTQSMVQSSESTDHDSEPSPKIFKHIKKLTIVKMRAANESAVETMLQPEVEVKKYTEMNTSLDDD